MSILKAMYSGVSGLNAETGALGVVGDNVANTNTIGFKQSRAIFANVLGAAIGSNEPGSGVNMVRTQQIFAQGGLVNTGQSTDVALSGDGFFVVKGSVDGVQNSFYTRAGQFTLRNDGTLINADGLSVQGYQADLKGQLQTTTGDIKLSTAPIPPKATSSMKITANLDASATEPAAAWDPNNPSATSNLATSLTVYDSVGNAHVADVYFRKTASGDWDYHVLAKGNELAGGGTGNVEIAGGNFQFTSDGALQTITQSTPGNVSFAGATPNQAIALDFGKSIGAGGTGLEGITQYASTSSVSSQKQDGYASGALSGVKIDSDGTVNGVYTNGQTIAAGKLAVAKFQSNDGLGRAGHNLWVATRDSGEAAMGDAGSGGRASLVSGSLEQSNVDVTQQFVELISHQRAFQANSKTITTADQMLQELMSIKQ
ncbi:Flagellar hook protein FlgE [Labilithrix luteola]|uniref:Flagellar hook protein FlgE n=1 Tax=Labilithrix luteola TaxID=1391654 RepID=A0A0K1PMG3_9BACT|nr:flagellar hook protein FlgE [Labilithrix luteola]AKU94713.1 Flagellar hook protein FlgE [Labilithrix luteola]